MDKGALRARIADLEGIENRTGEQEGELKELRVRLAQSVDQPGSQRVVCDHVNAKFGDRFCRNCGEQISMPPRAAVAELLREILEEDYEISEDKSTSAKGKSPQQPDSANGYELEAKWRAYEEKFFIGRKKFLDRKSFESATAGERNQELDRIGVKEREVEKAKKSSARESSRRAVVSR
jgi:hypothetical protein